MKSRSIFFIRSLVTSPMLSHDEHEPTKRFRNQFNNRLGGRRCERRRNRLIQPKSASFHRKRLSNFSAHLADGGRVSVIKDSFPHLIVLRRCRRSSSVDVLSFHKAPDAITVRTGFMKRMKLLVLMRSYETILYQTSFDFITEIFAQ